MEKYNVYFCTPYLTYEGIVACDEEEAIAKCQEPEEYDFNEPYVWIAFKQEEEENED